MVVYMLDGNGLLGGKCLVVLGVGIQALESRQSFIAPIHFQSFQETEVIQREHWL